MSRSGAFSEGFGPGLVYLAFRAGAWLAEHVPLTIGNGAARLGGRIAYHLATRKRSIVRANLARVVGEGPHLDGVVKGAFQSYSRYWLETFRLGRYTAEELFTMVSSESLDAIESALGEGKGVVVITAHFGFYDLGVAWIGAKGYPFDTVAEVLRPRALFEWFARIRERRGMRVIPSKPRDEARSRMLGAVESGRAIALLSDRDLGRRGVWASLFGEKTTLPLGPILLVTKTRAPLVTGAIYQTEEMRYRLDFERIPYNLTGDDDVDVPTVAQVIADAVERIVVIAPEQWHLFSTNWPSDETHLPPRGPRP